MTAKVYPYDGGPVYVGQDGVARRLQATAEGLVGVVVVTPQPGDEVWVEKFAPHYLVASVDTKAAALTGQALHHGDSPADAIVLREETGTLAWDTADYVWEGYQTSTDTKLRSGRWFKITPDADGLMMINVTKVSNDPGDGTGFVGPAFPQEIYDYLPVQATSSGGNPAVSSVDSHSPPMDLAYGFGGGHFHTNDIWYPQGFPLPLKAGHDYYLIVGEHYLSQGHFQLQFSWNIPTARKAAIAGAYTASAITIAGAGQQGPWNTADLPGSLIGANEINVGDPSGPTKQPWMYHERWFTFTPTANGTATLDTMLTTGSGTDLQTVIFMMSAAFRTNLDLAFGANSLPNMGQPYTNGTSRWVDPDLFLQNIGIFGDFTSGASPHAINGASGIYGSPWVDQNGSGSATTPVVEVVSVDANGNGNGKPFINTADGIGYALTDSGGATDYGLYITSPDVDASHCVGMIFRASDALNYWRIETDTSAHVKLVKVVAGVETVVATSTVAVDQNSPIVAMLNGDSIDITKGDVRGNGTALVSTTDAFNDTATNIGIYFKAVSASGLASGHIDILAETGNGGAYTFPDSGATHGGPAGTAYLQVPVTAGQQYFVAVAHNPNDPVDGSSLLGVDSPAVTLRWDIP